MDWVLVVLAASFFLTAYQQVYRPVHVEPELRARSKRRGIVWAVVAVALLAYAVFLAPA